MKALIEIVLVILSMFSGVAYALDQTETGFFYPIGTENFNQKCGTWLGRDTTNGGCYFDNFYHNGVDMMTDNLDAKVYAIADGTIYKRHCDDDSWGIGNCALFIRHKTYDGQIFTGLYGHIAKSSLPAGNDVYAGKPIGKTGNWCCGIHLHFGIFLGDAPPSTIAGVKGWGKMSNSQWTTPCEGNNQCTNGFVDPIDFIQTNYAYNPSTEKQAKCQGDICWEPKTATCETASSRHRIVNYPFARAEGADICAELQTHLSYIISAPNPQERVPEDHGWRKWWRAILNFFGRIARAEEIESFGTINTINVYTGTVVAGNATLAVHGAGGGYATASTDADKPDPPDFIVKKVWLENLFGEENYSFKITDEIKIRMILENIGSGSINSSSEIETRIYLSDGYKEDPHNEWIKIGAETTLGSELGPGESHSETEYFKLWQESHIQPGKTYNLVVCVDRIANQYNGDGAYPEKHESNNCSTEAVFIVEKSPPDTNFTANQTIGMAPLAVQFTDTSKWNPTAWRWNFGDGSYSNERNPVHTYGTQGSYSVSLTATNETGENTETKASYITIAPPPQITVTNPTGADNWRCAKNSDSKNIRWTMANFPQAGTVAIYYTLDNQATWRTINAATDNDGSYNWHMCQNKTVDTYGYIKIVSNAYPWVYGISQRFYIDHARGCE